MSTFMSEPGTRLGGRYRLEDRVAAAAGWAAWKAIDETLARAVTVVTFAAGFPRVREVLTAARAASRLTDARLAQVFDVEDDWDNAYIVMEWAAGETLGDMLAAGPVEPVAGARIIAEAAAALSVAHAAGLAHLCLSPESLRWTSAAASRSPGSGSTPRCPGPPRRTRRSPTPTGSGGCSTRRMTGMWPGPDYPALPPAPFTDGQPRRPRQVRAGVPAALDDVTCQAMQVPGRDGSVLATPGQLAGALAAELPPEEVPPAGPATRPGAAARGSGDEYWSERRRPADPAGLAGSAPQRQQRQPRQPRQGRGGSSRVRVAVIGVLALVVVIGVAAAARSFLHNGNPSAPTQQHRRAPAPGTSSQTTEISPVAAQGFDALNPGDSGDENTNQAVNVINHQAAGWSSQQYFSAALGGLKAGTGLILDMGHTVRLTSVTIRFGSSVGADVQLKLGTSETRSKTNLDSMPNVARRTTSAVPSPSR